MKTKIFHVSEKPNIKLFKPRPSPSKIKGLNKDCVFAIADELLHNYLLPRDCPRITYYASNKSLPADIQRFITPGVKFTIVTESGWYHKIKGSRLYLYQMPSDKFELIDEGAEYYVSYFEVAPLKIVIIEDLIAEILKRGVELRFTDNLKLFAQDIATSSLQFSNIRMRNAK